LLLLSSHLSSPSIVSSSSNLSHKLCCGRQSRLVRDRYLKALPTTPTATSSTTSPSARYNGPL
jgi:hypothetical protein